MGEGKKKKAKAVRKHREKKKKAVTVYFPSMGNVQATSWEAGPQYASLLFLRTDASTMTAPLLLLSLSYLLLLSPEWSIHVLDVPKEDQSVQTGDYNSRVHAFVFRRCFAGFPLGNPLSLRTSTASATGRQPPAPTNFEKRQMALQDPGSSTHSQKTISMRTLSVCACASGGFAHLIWG